MANEAPATWDKAAVKWLLKDPLKLQGYPAYWQWILERGGLQAVQRALRALPLPSNAALLLQMILDDPHQKAATYADRLSLSMTSYFRWFDDLVARLILALNQLPSALPQPAPPREHPAPGEPTLPRQPSTLPLPTSRFIGRQAEVLRVRQLLRQPEVRLVTLTGPGGIGKTSLSIEVMLELGAAFADGIVYVPLAAIRDPNVLGVVLIQALGLQQADPRPAEEVLINALVERELLLVLDNFEQLIAAAPLVGTLLARAPRLKILVTSRGVLRMQGEHVVLVPPLTIPPSPPAGASAEASAEVLAVLAESEAVRLFVERAHQVSPDFQLSSANAWAVAEICRQLEGMPLAIVLAAARSKVLSPQAIAARLQDRLALLTRGPLDLPDRQRTLRQTLDWSYALLSPGQQALFRQLAIFAGGCTLDAVCAVCQLDEVQALDGLAELIDQSMLQSQEQPDGETRFSMLETIREYGEELLAQSGEAATLWPRHARYYLELAEAAEPELTSGPRQKEWHVRLVQEYENIRAALSWSLAGQDAEVGVALVAAFWKFWLAYGYLVEARKWLLLALEQSVGWEVPARCKVLYGAGWFTFAQGEHLKAGELFTEALELARRLNFQRGIAMALHGVGEIQTRRGEFAMDCFEESLAIFRALGDQEEIAWSLAHLGSMHRDMGDVAEAARLYEESITLFRAVEQQRGLFWTMCSLVTVLQDQESGQLRGIIEEALAWFRALGDRLSMAWALLLLARSALDEEQLSLAGGYVAEALALFREMGETPGLAETLCCQGHVAFEHGHLAEAARSYRESLSLQQDHGTPSGMAECLEGLAAVAARQGAGRQAALLCGAAEALLLAAQARREPFALRRSQRTLALIRTVFPAETIDAAFAEGQQLSYQQLI